MSRDDFVQLPRSRFIRVKCLECENEQIIFGSAATEVKCLKCGKTLARPAGGKAILEQIAREIETLP